jgi:hypothetical protein
MQLHFCRDSRSLQGFIKLSSICANQPSYPSSSSRLAHPVAGREMPVLNIPPKGRGMPPQKRHPASSPAQHALQRVTLNSTFSVCVALDRSKLGAREMFCSVFDHTSM